MPLFYFELEEVPQRIGDAGVELRSVQAAKLEAVRLMSDLMHDRPRMFALDDNVHLTVRDADRLTLFRLNVFMTDAPYLRTAGLSL